MEFIKYFVTALVVGTTAICLGWIASPDTAVVIWHSLPGLGYFRGMFFGAFDPVLDELIRHQVKHTPISQTDGRTSDPSLPNRLFTVEELKQYDGTEGSKGLYLAFYGRVYDVSKGKEHYGPGGGYEFFAACDATRAFVTGDFTNGLTDDIEGLSPREMMEVKNWAEFYQKDYTPVGILQGRFYDANGQPTEALVKGEALIQEGMKEKEAEEEDKKQFPPCNSEWKKGTGRVWCSLLSGGVSRDWEGLPRKYYQQGASNWRCACVRKVDLNKGMFREFQDCQPEANSCNLIN